jgi:hypothetical protein
VIAAVAVLLAGLAVIAAVLGVRALDAAQWRRSLVAFRLHLPANLTADDVVGWLGMVAASTHAPRWFILPLPPLGLEVIATRRGVAHYVLAPKGSQGKFLSSLRAGLPGARIEEDGDVLAPSLRFRVAGELTMTNRHRPLAFDRAEATSAALLASLQPLHEDEEVRVRWALTSAGTPSPVRTAAPSAMKRSWAGYLVEGEAPADAEAVRAERIKQRDPLLHVVMRVGVAAAKQERAYLLFSRTWSTLHGPNAPGVRLVRRWLPSSVVAQRVVQRALPLTRWPLLLNTRELSGLVAFPLEGLSLPGLAPGVARQLAPSPGIPGGGTVLAQSNYPGLRQLLAIRSSDRLKHLYLVGPTGVGKSTLIANMAVQDAAAGAGLALIDPKSDLVGDVMTRLPAERHEDVIVLDPSATHRPVGFNLLGGLRSEQDRELVVDHVVHIMSELWRDSWGPRTGDVLRNAVLSLTHTRPADGSVFTLAEIPELLTNPSFRRFVTGQPGVPDAVRPFWYAYEQMSPEAQLNIIGPVMNKLRAFTTRSSLRLMLGQSRGIDVADVLTKRRILLVPLSKGTLGTGTAQLVGALLVASLWQATLARARIPTERRRPAYIYLDEFQDVLRLPLDVADILAQARGLGVGLTLAHQHLGQLPESVKTAVLGTARTQVVFQLDYDDAKVFERRFAPLTADDLMGLAPYEVALRLSVQGQTLRPVTGVTLPLPEPTTNGQELATSSQERYGLPRADVETALKARLGSAAGPDSQLGRRRRRGEA